MPRLSLYSEPMRRLFLLAILSACTSSTPPPQNDDASTPEDARAQETRDAEASSDAEAPSACTRSGPELVRFTTDDGVTLAADLYTSGDRGGPAVILLHMIPPSNDRTNYPAAFIEALRSRGLSVLNVDRRGAGDSGGVATEAYQGPNGKLDAKAAAAFLAAHACAFDPNRVGIAGASNGTTTALDYTVIAAPAPKALVFLTAGTYTENNNRIRDQRAKLDPIPILFVYSTQERAFSAAQQTGAASAWEFEEYANGDHGTRMFAARSESIERVAEFFGTKL
jgi:pimeloyl-ACP methyl ester carboxylesterase